ncbi:Oxidative stress-induced growth inhibitor 2 [Hypsibius exemplaris]|uniref:Oxidative stress-induced growth inhibitor 2 n=1 Tax=Hypsibius exemplaris TaxID=2072580 RepID=A0A1W0X7S1_HYPEX|nr:Oxidative stress-induced growth inhibitor 2 [Hypsibius exemplaris]
MSTENFIFPGNRFPPFTPPLEVPHPAEEFGPPLSFLPDSAEYAESDLEFLPTEFSFRPTKAEIEAGRMELSYNLLGDVYLQSGEKRSTPGWRNSVWRAYNIERKEEFDWKMGYLARVDMEGSPDENVYDGLLEYRFNLKDAGMVVKKLFLRLPYKTYRDGKVRVLVCSRDDYTVVLDTQELNPVVRATGWEDFIIRVELSGAVFGDGPAYQNSQLLRQPLNQEPISADWKEPFKATTFCEIDRQPISSAERRPNDFISKEALRSLILDFSNWKTHRKLFDTSAAAGCETTCTVAAAAAAAAAAATVVEGGAVHTTPLAETTDVVIIGNGPSALTLSYLLNGNWPYYRDDSHHPDEIIHARLNCEKDKSILETDFVDLCSGISGQSRNAVANLFDQLLHPSSVFGDVTDGLQSCVKWQAVPHKIPHLVLGPHPPGGAWQAMHGSKKALSFNNWLELPGLPVADWAARHGCCRTRLTENNASRLPLVAWKAYYRDYPVQMGLQDSLRTGYQVLSVRNLTLPANDQETGEPGGTTMAVPSEEGALEVSTTTHPWEIKGVRFAADGESEVFVIRAKKVVLATGTAESPKKLSIAGEYKPWTGHTYDDLHNFVTDNVDEETADHLGGSKRCWCRVVIVGSGLTAADAVITALTAGCHVYHAFDPKHTILSQLSERLYPEYAAIWKLMSGERPANSAFCGYYTPFANGRIIKITNDHQVQVENSKGVNICLSAVDYVAVLIGSSPNLTYVQSEIVRHLPIKAGQPLDAKRNPIAIDQYTHESVYQTGLYALGPLAGDNYVRFIPGGAVAVAKSLFDSIDAR